VRIARDRWCGRSVRCGSFEGRTAWVRAAGLFGRRVVQGGQGRGCGPGEGCVVGRPGHCWLSCVREAGEVDTCVGGSLVRRIAVELRERWDRKSLSVVWCERRSSGSVQQRSIRRAGCWPGHGFGRTARRIDRSCATRGSVAYLRHLEGLRDVASSSARSLLSRRASSVMMGCEARETTYPHLHGDGSTSVSGSCDCQHQGGRDPGGSGKVNPGEVPINVVIYDKPKMLGGLNQKKGVWPGAEDKSSPAADVAPPAKRHNLTHSDRHRERGKPVALPSGKADRKASR